MKKGISQSLIRFFALWALQVFVFKQVVWGTGGVNYLQAFIYPLFILLLPFTTPRSLVVLLGFVMGLAIDWLYLSPGLHAGALTFTAYARQWVIQIIKPREGYNINDSPTASALGLSWMIRYVAISLFFHTFVYYFLEAFTYLLLLSIFMKTVVTGIISVLISMILLLAYNPEA